MFADLIIIIAFFLGGSIVIGRGPLKVNKLPLKLGDNPSLPTTLTHMYTHTHTHIHT